MSWKIEIYNSILIRNDRSEFNDLWLTLDDMMSYVSNVRKDNVLRLEAFVRRPESEDSVRYDAAECVYEYDATGCYMYNV